MISMCRRLTLRIILKDLMTSETLFASPRLLSGWRRRRRMRMSDNKTIIPAATEGWRMLNASPNTITPFFLVKEAVMRFAGTAFMCAPSSRPFKNILRSFGGTFKISINRCYIHGVVDFLRMLETCMTYVCTTNPNLISYIYIYIYIIICLFPFLFNQPNAYLRS